MSVKTVLFYDKVKNVWQEIAQNGVSDTSDFKLDIYKKMLNFFQVGDFYYFVFDVKSGNFEYISQNIESILGYSSDISALEFVNNIHPEDQPYFIDFEKKLNTFFRKLPLDKITKYKIQYDFRIKDLKNQYKRILHQMMIIQYDDNKNLLRSMGIHTDISHIKPYGNPSLSFIGLDGEPSYYNVLTYNDLLIASKSLFSEREKQIIQLVINGQSTASIAKTLFLSTHTINSHRKRILSKSGCSTWSEFVVKYIREGF